MSQTDKTSIGWEEGTWTLEGINTPIPYEWNRTKTGELRSNWIDEKGELKVMESLIRPIPAQGAKALYRIHLVTGENMDEVVNEGLFADYRIVAASVPNAREKAIHEMGRIGWELDEFAIVVELIGYVG